MTFPCIQQREVILQSDHELRKVSVLNAASFRSEQIFNIYSIIVLTIYYKLLIPIIIINSLTAQTYPAVLLSTLLLCPLPAGD
jgi:hypothetical protein